MKKIKLPYILIILFTLVLTGCNFSNFFAIRLTGIEISDNVTNYVLGDVFDNDNELTINAKYSNNTVKTINYGNQDFKASLTYTSSEGKTINHDSSKPFETTGKYKLVIKSGTISSNTLTLNVITEHVYVSSLSLNGESEVKAWEKINLNTTVIPTNHTTSLTYEASVPSLVTLTPTENGVEVYAKKAGELDIIVKSLKSKTEEIKAIHHLTIISSSRVITMKQTYNDYIKNSPYNVSSTPLSGNVKLLVIPVWFSDSNQYIKSSTHKDTVRSDIQKAYFGSSDEIGWYSVREYYEIESQGRLKLSGTVSDWFECGVKTTTAGSSNYDTSGLVTRAVDWYFTNNPTDSRSNYDYDKDGVLDGVMLIYAAPDYDAADKQNNPLKTYTNLWAYCFWIQPKVTPSTIYPNAFFWASYDFMYGEGNAYAKTGSIFHSGDSSHFTVDAHTYIHEMGHMFGLEDYYDYSKTYKPAAGFSMQDYNIGGHDPFSLLSFGWVDAYLPDESITLTIRNFTDGHDVVILSPGFNEYASPFDEYLLVELYTPTGTNEMDSRYKYCGYYPTGTSQTGIRLWHVDARLAVANSTGTSFSLLTSANVKQKRIRTAFTNTYNFNDVDKEYLSVLGSNYYSYNLLQLIRNSTSKTHQCNDTLEASDLFTTGDSFTMSKFSKQFVNGAKLNNGKTLGWSFTVNAIDINPLTREATATITFTRG